MTSPCSQAEEEILLESKIKNLQRRTGWAMRTEIELGTNPVRLGEKEASCLFHHWPSAVKRNFTAVAFKKFKPFKWFKSSPGAETWKRLFQLAMATNMPKLLTARGLKKCL
jgi:hypothetical protein